MQARYPDVEDWVGRDGVRLGFEVFGRGATTVLLMDFATTTCESLAVAIITTVGQPGGYRNVKTDGADRVARMIAELI